MNVVEELPDVARPVIRERFRRDSCLVSTAIAVDVLDYFGIRARPVEVSILVGNAAAAECLSAELPMTEWPEDAWTVGTVRRGEQPDDERVEKSWDGAHLVALTDDGWLVDLAADQYAREHRAMPVEALTVELGEAGVARFEAGEAIALGGPEGSFIVYRRYPDQRPSSWRSVVDWRDRSRRRDLVGRIIRDLRRRGA